MLAGCQEACIAPIHSSIIEGKVSGHVQPTPSFQSCVGGRMKPVMGLHDSGMVMNIGFQAWLCSTCESDQKLNRLDQQSLPFPDATSPMHGPDVKMQKSALRCHVCVSI